MKNIKYLLVVGMMAIAIFSAGCIAGPAGSPSDRAVFGDQELKDQEQASYGNTSTYVEAYIVTDVTKKYECGWWKNPCYRITYIKNGQPVSEEISQRFVMEKQTDEPTPMLAKVSFYKTEWWYVLFLSNKTEMKYE